jgi:hypothetical protein
LERLRIYFTEHRKVYNPAFLPFGRSGRSFFHILRYMRLKKKQSKLIKEYNGDPFMCCLPFMRVQYDP